MADVVSLSGDPVPQARQPVPAVIKCLEHYLQMAREGELQGVQIVAVTGDKSTWASFEGLINYHLVGRMTAVQHRIIAALEA